MPMRAIALLVPKKVLPVGGSPVEVVVLFERNERPTEPRTGFGDRAEVAFRQSMILSGGSLSVFWSTGIAATLSTLALVLAMVPIVARVRSVRTP